MNLFVYADAPQQIDLQILPPQGANALTVISGAADAETPLITSFVVTTEGAHILTAQLRVAGLPADAPLCQGRLPWTSIIRRFLSFNEYIPNIR